MKVENHKSNFWTFFRRGEFHIIYPSLDKDTIEIAQSMKDGDVTEIDMPLIEPKTYTWYWQAAWSVNQINRRRGRVVAIVTEIDDT